MFLNREITKDEYLVYSDLRLSADPYGIAVTSLSSIRTDLLRGSKDNNYANKIMLALKKQRLLFYKNRTGSRGSFEVRFPHFALPNSGKITDIEKYFDNENVELSPEATAIDIPEVGQSMGDESQNSGFKRDDIGQMLRAINKIESVRGFYNDTETNKEKIQKQISKDLGDH